MNQVVVKGESVYQCDVCTRKVRVPTNRFGVDVLQRCNITQHCKGKLHRVLLKKDINNTPAFAPEIQGLNDWFQRKVLFTHTQTIETAVWTVNHGLGNQAVLHTFVNRQGVNGQVTLEQEDPVSTRIIDLDTVELTFLQPRSGTVQCVSLTSPNVANAGSTKVIVPDTLPLQLTNNTADIAIATLSSANVIDITVEYKSSGTDPVEVEYVNIGSVPSLTSPWVGVRKVVVNGKRYTVRSFNLQTTANGAVAFEAGLIPSGSTFKIQAVNGNSIAQHDVLFLFANAPFASVDRIYDKFADAAMVSTSDPEMYIDSGKGYCRLSAVKSVYPAILVV